MPNQIKKKPQQSKGIMMSSIPAEFKQTMKHNSSNQSITGKKMMNQIKKPSDSYSSNKRSFMSPYAKKPVGGKN